MGERIGVIDGPVDETRGCKGGGGMKGGQSGRDWVMNLNIKAITLPAHCRAGWRWRGEYRRFLKCLQL